MERRYTETEMNGAKRGAEGSRLNTGEEGLGARRAPSVAKSFTMRRTRTGERKVTEARERRALGEGRRAEGGRTGVQKRRSFVVRQINNVVIVNALEQHAAGLHWRLFFAMLAGARRGAARRSRSVYEIDSPIVESILSYRLSRGCAAERERENRRRGGKQS